MMINVTPRRSFPLTLTAIYVLSNYLCDAFSATTSTINPLTKDLSTTTPLKKAAFDASAAAASPKIGLHQNWWPVALVNTLDEKSPNAERVLNKDLVLWHDGDEWRCMDDMCAHRFAPLSEGRVFFNNKTNRRCLQCSYHGWEFDSDGSCQRIPQAADPIKAAKAAKVPSYPVRIGAGIAWVWPDDASAPFAETIPLPISPMLLEWENEYPQSAYQRDLPYGYELLAENVIDMSHLPFSHHEVLSSRDNGIHIPFKMLSIAEKENVWEKEASSIYANISASEKVLPAYQVEIRKGRAQFSDPIFSYNLMGTNEPDENSTSFLGFYPPSHIRYHRTPMSGLSSNTELFVCPQEAGKCRAIIFNPFEGGMKKVQVKKNDDDDDDDDDDKSRFKFLSRIGNYLLRKIILSKFMGTNNHLLTSDVFDGDNVFLAQQGERLAKNNLGYEDYLVPSSADTMSKIFRKWLDNAAAATMRSNNCRRADKIVEAAVGVSSDGTSPYATPVSRRVLLDRYESHTKNCPICSKALAKLERREVGLKYAVPALFGMTGASLIATVLSIVVANNAANVANLPMTFVVKTCARLFGASLLLSALAVNLKRFTETSIQKFHYVEHSHQD